MPKLNLQYLCHLMRRVDSTLMLGKIWRQKEKEMAEDEMIRYYHWLNGHESEQTPGDRDRGGWRVAAHGVTRSQTKLGDWTKTNLFLLLFSCISPTPSTDTFFFSKLKAITWLFFLSLRAEFAQESAHTSDRTEGLWTCFWSPNSREQLCWVQWAVFSWKKKKNPLNSNFLEEVMTMKKGVFVSWQYLLST